MEREINIEQLIEKLKEEIEEMDNESIHAVYDTILYELAKKQDKKTVEHIDKLVEGIAFWYA